MKKYAEILKKSQLFNGIANADEIIKSLKIKEKLMKKEIIFIIVVIVCLASML